MKKTFKVVLSLIAMTFMAVSAFAQITTSSLAGSVAEADGQPLVGAVVEAVHTPSGTQYYAVANSEGRYTIQGMRPGGPYELTVTFVGYQTTKIQNVTLPLGEIYEQDIVMNDSEVLDEVVIVANASKFATDKTGAATNINAEKMSTLPSVNRSISDIAKFSPYANGMSFAGGDGRSTNFTVDGSNFNNNFGLSDKLPGGGSPISIDAIEEVQVAIAPYDVRQTNFIGGGINAITKSGTNTLKGTVYGYYRNQDFRGNKVAGKELGDRTKESHRVIGFTLGGPIIKDKLFFFVNAEQEKTPGQVIKYRANKGGEEAKGNVSRCTEADMQKVHDFLLSEYGYEAGSYTDFPGDESNLKVLARIDWNINKDHHLALRYNFTKNTAWNAPNGNSSDTGYRLNNTYRTGNQSMAFANNMYSMDNKVSSFSLDLNSRFSDKLSNQLLATYSMIEDIRGSKSDPFPHVDIMYEGQLQPYMSMGYELFTWNNGVHNRVITVKDDVTYLAGNHKLTAGVSFENQFANNAYMRNGTMYYRYASLEDFLQKKAPESFAITYGWNGELNPTAQVTFNQLGLYLQDEWKVTKQFKLSAGVRFDDLIFNDKDIATNKKIYELTFRDGMKIDTGKWPESGITVSPRVGFVWDVKGDQSLKVRGGTGLFLGRLPLVYFTNMPTNAAMVQNSVQYKTKYDNGVKQSSDPNLAKFASTGEFGKMLTNVSEAIDKLGLQKELTDANHTAGNTVSGVDPKFKMPQIWKTSLAVDYTLPVNFPFTITAEGMFNKMVNGVIVDNINIDNSKLTARFAGVDNRLNYKPVTDYVIVSGKNAPYLTNTQKGYGYTASLAFNLTPVKNLDIMLAYTHTESKEVSGLPGSDPLSTWQGLITVDGPNFGTPQRSQYVVPDKIVASISYFVPFSIFGGKGFHASLFYTGMTGYGYSYCYNNDMNDDGINNDLMYIYPKGSDINFIDKNYTFKDASKNFSLSAAEQAAAYDKFVAQDKYLSKNKGKYAEAYATRAPWVNRFDLRITEDFAFKIGNTKHNFQLNLDLMNVGNLLNSNWGVYRNNSISNGSRILNYEGTNAAGEPTFSMCTNANSQIVSQSFDYYRDYTQCWQFQIGIKYLFN